MDGNIRLWNESSGEILHAFSNSEIGDVYSVENYDGRYALSGSEDGEIRMRGAEGSERLPEILTGHTELFLFPALRSPSGTRFVSWSNERTICVWDAEGGLT